MKLSKEELKNKLAETIKDDNLTISLLEDIEDSWQDSSNDTEKDEQIQKLTGELEDLKQKYKERFLTKDATAENTIVQNPTNTILNEVEQPKEPRKFEDLFNEKGELK